MKKLVSVFFIFLGFGAYAQTSVDRQNQNGSDATIQRSAATSVRNDVSPTQPLPYDINDPYMGRKAEFLNQMIVTELPADFPKYEQQWDVKDYNAVVDAYYINHPEILKEKFRQKVKYIQAVK